MAAGCLGGDDPAGEGWGFRNVTDEAGIDHVVGYALPQRVSVMATVSGGVSAADVDGNGFRDVLVVDAGYNTLWRNRGDGTFENVTASSGIATDGFTTKGLFLDVEADGDQDLLLVAFGGKRLLYENDGTGNFTEVSEEAGVAGGGWAYGASAADVDGDGRTDFTVAHYGAWPEEPPESNANATNAPRDLLFVNRGNGTFEEVGLERGLAARRWTLGHAFADHDGDGDQDLYLNADFGYDVLYENDGTGNFTDVTREAGTVTDGNGMGPVWADVDGDLDLDLFATNIHLPDHGGIPQFDGNDLWVNQGDGAFEQGAAEAGLADGGWGWDSAWEDFDHDVDLDAAQANGMASHGGPDRPDRFYDTEPRLLDERPDRSTPRHAYSEPYNDSRWLLLKWDEDVNAPVRSPSMGSYQVDRFFRNAGNGTFRDVAGDVGLGGWADARAYASLDVDHDVDRDLVRTAAYRRPDVLENTAVDGDGVPGDRHWLAVDVQGTTVNPDGIGAAVVARAGDDAAMRLVAAGDGFMSQSSDLVHFGLGNASTVDELEVRWPDPRNESVTFQEVAADQAVRVVEGEGLEAGIWSGS